MQPKLERRGDPEVAPTPVEGPEQIGVDSALAVTSRPSAVTRSTEMRLSQASPKARSVHPEPPPSVRPATPVLETQSSSGGQPVGLGGAVKLAPRHARPDPNASAVGVNVDALHRADVDDQAAVVQTHASD